TLMSISSDSETMGIKAEKVIQAQISTIHSFCQSVIREKYYVLGLSPSFNIASEKDNTRLLKKTLAEILDERSLAEDEDLARLYLNYGKRNGRALNDMIIAVYHALMVMPEPEAYKTRMQTQYMQADFTETIASILFDESKKKLAHATEILQNLRILASVSGFQKIESLLLGYIKNLGTLIEYFEDKDFDAAFNTTVFDANLALGEVSSDEIKKVFKGGRDSAKKLIDECLKDNVLVNLHPKLNQELPVMSADAHALLDLALTLRERFSEAKLKKNTLDFSDLEHYAYEILKDPEQAKDFNYKYIFIDEYQDTNPLQEALIEKIKGAHNLFMVGDVKQSIYGFRHADSDIFLNKQNQYKEYIKKTNDEDELIRMNENFRSSQPVISAVNLLMGEILTPEFGEIDYKNKEALVHGANLSDGKTELLLIDSGADFYPPESNGDALSSSESEAFAIANHIISQKGKPFFCRETGEEKLLDFSDMVVLLREVKNSGTIYKRVFESCGIPVDITFSSGGTNLPETEQFAAILKCILNPTDDIALISAMKYSYFEISFSDIADVRISAKEKKQSFYSSVKEYIEHHDDALSGRLIHFFETLAHLKDKSLILSGEAFLEYVYHHLQFEEVLAASPRKSLKAEALKGYIRALLAESSKSAHLARMVSLLDEMKQNDEMLDTHSAQKNPNSVRIMTIHKSKGLEFPVVYVAGLQKPFHKDNKADFVMDKSLGLGFKIIKPKKNYKGESLIYQSLVKKQWATSLHEAVRVLYVAMTRAENQLFLVGGVKGLKNSLARWLTHGKDAQWFANNYLDMMMPALLNKKGFAEGFALDRFLSPQLSISSLLPIHILPKRGYAYTGGADRIALLDDFLNQPPKPITLGYTYKNSETLGIPSKRSVSSLKAKETTPIIRREVAFTALDASSLTAAERGTAFHTYMQHADFEHNTIEEIKNHIRSLVDASVLSDEEAASLSPARILSVLQSDIIARAKKSPLLYREKNFSLKLDSGQIGFPAGEMVVVQGTIDLCFLEGNAFVLLDYKTDQVTKDSLPTRVDAYKKQLETYALALAELTGYSVKEKYLYFLNMDCIKV
ncbi:MAG: UvrD-helicase domain-containing protein, partial [Eubacteriales bacterium]